jgi:hypothetical protein
MSAVLADVMPHKIQVINYDKKYRSQCIELARQMVKDSAYGDMPFDGEKVMQQIEGMDGNIYFSRIAVCGDVLYGGFIGVLIRSLFCDQLIAKDVGWWVSKDMRGSMAAIMLLREFEEWAKMKKAVKIMLGQASGINVERTTKLYEKCGYKVVGFNTVKGVDHG